MAITDADKKKGLMGLDHLADNKGMLFVFSTPQEANFRMKDTQIPLDIVWLDSGYTILHYTAAEPCTTAVCPLYNYTGLVSSVLELNAGTMQKYGIPIGGKLQQK